MAIDEKVIETLMESLLQHHERIYNNAKALRKAEYTIEQLEQRVQKLESEKYMNKKRDKPYAL